MKKNIFINIPVLLATSIMYLLAFAFYAMGTAASGGKFYINILDIKSDMFDLMFPIIYFGIIFIIQTIIYAVFLKVTNQKIKKSIIATTPIYLLVMVLVNPWSFKYEYSWYSHNNEFTNVQSSEFIEEKNEFVKDIINEYIKTKYNKNVSDFIFKNIEYLEHKDVIYIYATVEEVENPGIYFGFSIKYIKDSNEIEFEIDTFKFKDEIIKKKEEVVNSIINKYLDNKTTIYINNIENDDKHTFKTKLSVFINEELSDNHIINISNIINEISMIEDEHKYQIYFYILNDEYETTEYYKTLLFSVRNGGDYFLKGNVKKVYYFKEYDTFESYEDIVNFVKSSIQKN